MELKGNLPGDFVPGRVSRMEPITAPALGRIRFMARLLDTIFVLPGGFRIGLDPIVGLIPGVGDAISTGLSLYIVYEAAKLGIRKRILAVMLWHVTIESLVGLFPVLGDLFDAFYKANMKNLALAELHYSPAAKPRSGAKIVGVLGLFFLICLSIVGWLGVLVFKALWEFLTKFP
jgi:hypothetical protein